GDSSQDEGEEDVKAITIDVYLAKSLAEKLYLFQVELEMAINTMSPNYCRSKGEQIALNVDGTTYEETNTYSTYVLPSCHSSCIRVRFSRPESEQARQRRVQSYDFLQKKQAEEPWVHLHYHSLNDGRSEHERQYLYCQAMDTADNSELVKTPNNVLSMAQLRTLPLAEQIKTLMKNVKLMPFANLMGLLASGTDSTAVLRCVQQVALLIQGNWVVKSDVLYPKNTCSPLSGVPAEVLCRGRDFVMWRFTLERSLMRKEVAAIIKLPPEDVKDFLEHMAVPRINRGWEFALPSDSGFIKKHPDVAHRQNMLWLGIQSKLEKVFNFNKEDFMPKNAPTPGVYLYLDVSMLSFYFESEVSSVLQLKPPVSPLLSSTTTTTTSAEPVHVSGQERLKAAQERARQSQVALQRELLAKRQAMQAGAQLEVKQEPLSDGEGEQPMDTTTAGTASAVNGSHNGYSGTSSPDLGNGVTPSPELRLFVSKTFRKECVLTLSELKRLLNLHLASLPAGHAGALMAVSDHMLQDTVLLSQCKQILVPHRRLLYEVFATNYRVRKKVIQARLVQEFGDDLAKADLDRLLKECCVSLGGLWYLKGTTQS
ncbi:hypothetical protein CRUP_033296, partial [Coryphaenoides rupestris]